MNDTYGHAVGDVALKSIGYILREYEKKYDGLVGRYGGDEFVLILADLENTEDLENILEELSRRLHFSMTQEGETIPVQCSIGVAVRRQGENLEQWIARADEALYFVKQNGKGQYRISTD